MVEVKDLKSAKRRRYWPVAWPTCKRENVDEETARLFEIQIDGTPRVQWM